MKTLKIVGAVLAVLLLVFLVGGMFMPKGYQVERTQKMTAPAVVVFDQVNDLRKWEAWSPWKAMDPEMKITYSDNPVGEWASYSWSSAASGEGSLTIAKSEAPKSIETELDFGDRGKAKGSWSFEEADGVTTVTWTMSGQNEGIAGGWFTLMIDGMVGPQFEEGLEKLMDVAETTPLPVE